MLVNPVDQPATARRSDPLTSQLAQPSNHGQIKDDWPSNQLITRSFENDQPWSFEDDQPWSLEDDQPCSFEDVRPRSIKDDRPWSIEDDQPRSIKDDRPCPNKDDPRTKDNLSSTAFASPKPMEDNIPDDGRQHSKGGMTTFQATDVNVSITDGRRHSGQWKTTSRMMEDNVPNLMGMPDQAIQEDDLPTQV